MGLSEFFARLRGREGVEPPDAEGGVHSSRVLPRFLTALQHREQPVLLDLGPVAAGNLGFFGEHLGCKVHVEDLYADLERVARQGGGDSAALVAMIDARFPQPDASVDGILCWDLFDYLDKPAAQALARQLIRVLRPGGVIFALFASTRLPEGTSPFFTRYQVADPSTLQYRTQPAIRGRGLPLQNRDFQRLFEPLRITEQFLLKHHVREVLFRKAADA